MIHDEQQPAHLTSFDTYLLRDTLRVRCEETSRTNLRYYQSYDKFVLRFFYKHQEGTLWCFNRPSVSSEYFKEVPSLTGTRILINKNRIIDTEEQRFIEEDEENDVDLERTMWLIVRKKRSINKVLKHFCPEMQTATLRVRDIIKFGRVNFKITTLKCAKLKPEYQGSCYS